MTKDSLNPLVDRLKALAHPARLRILALLRQGELCVCQITAILGIPTSTASEHLSELRRAGLLAERKEGRWVFYGLRATGSLEALVEALWPHLEQMDQVARDGAAAAGIREVPVEITCSRAKSCRKNLDEGARDGQ